MSQLTLTSTDLDDKKEKVCHVDVVRQATELSLDGEYGFTKAQQRKIIRKVDLRLIVTLGVINCIALMDRTNLGAASIAGMTKDLKLNIGYRYSLVVLLFFVTYILAQPPTTVLCRKIGPRPFLAVTAFTWGILMIGFGFAKNWVALIPLRLILGICEAGFFPGAIYLISTWYVRYEVSKRYAFFYTIGIVANACAGILAFGLMQMDGVGGIEGWRWIFIMEGILTCIIGVVSYFTLLDFPDQAVRTAKHFLNEQEIQFLIGRIERDRDDAHVEPFSFKRWISAGADPKIWAFAMICFCGTTVAYSLQYFLPTILHNEMGFSIGTSQCLLAPPYAFAVIFVIGGGWIGDKYRFRGPVIVFSCGLALIGLPVMAFTKNSIARYIGVFFVTAGSSTILPTTWAYQANNIRGQWKRAFASATLVGSAGLGGIAGGLVFRSQDAPGYRPGIYAAMACNGVTILIVAVQTWYFRRENWKADHEGKVLEGNANFRFTI